MTNEEVNIAVARKLGKQCRVQEHPWSCKCKRVPGYVFNVGADCPDTSSLLLALPNYSTNIAAAWEIVNQFHEFTIGTELRENDCWFCEIRPQVGDPVRMNAATAMLAICEAFLKLSEEKLSA